MAGCGTPAFGRFTAGGGYAVGQQSSQPTLTGGIGCAATACQSGCPVLGPDVPRGGDCLKPGSIVVTALQSYETALPGVGEDVVAVVPTVPLASGTVVGLRWFPRAAAYFTGTGITDIRVTLTENVSPGTTLVLRTVDGAGTVELLPLDTPTGTVTAAAVGTTSGPLSLVNADDSFVVYTLGVRGTVPLYMLGWGPDPLQPTDAERPVFQPLTDAAHTKVLPPLDNAAADAPFTTGADRAVWITRLQPVIEDTVNNGAGTAVTAYVPETWTRLGATLAKRNEAWFTSVPFAGTLDTAAGVKPVFRVAADPGQLAALALREGAPTASIGAQFEVVVTANLPPSTTIAWTASPYDEPSGGLDGPAAPTDGVAFEWTSPARTLLAGTAVRYTLTPGAPPTVTVTIFDGVGTFTDVGTVQGARYNTLDTVHSWIAAVTDTADPASVTNALENTPVQYVAALRSTVYEGGLPPSMHPGLTTSTELWPATSALPAATWCAGGTYHVPLTTLLLHTAVPTQAGSADPLRFKALDDGAVGVNAALTH